MFRQFNGGDPIVTYLRKIRLENVDIDVAVAPVGGVVHRYEQSGQSATCITSCSVQGGIIKNASTGTGGVVGYMALGTITPQGRIQWCFNTADIEGVNRVGGVVGAFVGTRSSGQVLDCYNTGTVRGNNFVGGVVGAQASNTSGISNVTQSSVTRCYSSGDVEGVSYVGGVLGGKEQSSNNVRFTVSDCFGLMSSIKRASGTDTTFGRIVGSLPTNTTCTNVYALDSMVFIP